MDQTKARGPEASERSPRAIHTVRPAFLDRGERITRIDFFVDAAFAFSLTLLMIAGDHIPTSVDHLVNALKNLPAYALSFLLLLKFWTAHVAWSRRYGLDDALSQWLSLLLVFLVLVFVYPMRMVFAVLFSALSGGFFPANFTVSALSDVSALFVTFGIAFGSLGAVMWLLHLHAWRRRAMLALSPAETVMLHAAMVGWLLIPLVAAASIVAALLIPARQSAGWWLGFPGLLYFTLNIATPILRRRAARQAAQLQAG